MVIYQITTWERASNPILYIIIFPKIIHMYILTALSPLLGWFSTDKFYSGAGREI
jgi:hypothetical protein